MRILATLLFAISSALAYEVTYPTNTEGWTTSGPNVLSWNRVDTDPLNFTVVLTNQGQGYTQVLDNSVDGTLGSIDCSAPTGGWPTGTAFRVNIAEDAQNLDTLLAQSPQFNITQGTSSSSSGSTSSTSSGTSSGTGTSSRSATSTRTGSSSTSSDTSTTPTSTSAGSLAVDARAGLLTAAAALTALITTLF